MVWLWPVLRQWERQEHTLLLLLDIPSFFVIKISVDCNYHFASISNMGVWLLLLISLNSENTYLIVWSKKQAVLHSLKGLKEPTPLLTFFLNSHNRAHSWRTHLERRNTWRHHMMTYDGGVGFPNLCHSSSRGSGWHRQVKVQPCRERVKASQEDQSVDKNISFYQIALDE